VSLRAAWQRVSNLDTPCAGELGYDRAPLRPRVATPWSAVTSRPGFMGATRGPEGRAGPLRAVAGPRAQHAEMRPTSRALTIFARYGGWGCLANFTREEGPFWLTSLGTCPCRGPDAHTRASGWVKIATASPDGSEQIADARYS
jgi:hypothetical protein